MGVSDWAAIGGDAIAFLALAYSILSNLKSRAAKQAAAQSEDRSRSMSVSMEKMAAALEEIAGTRSVAAPSPQWQPREGGASGPAAPFSVEIGEADAWVLRNVGTATVTNVRFPSQGPGIDPVDGRPVVAAQWSPPFPESAANGDGRSLGPFQSAGFTTGSAAPGPSTRIEVTSDQTGPVWVALPTRRYSGR